MKKIFLICLFPFFIVYGQNQINNVILEKRKFTPAELREDFSLMKEVFTTLHPALYEFNTKQNFARLLDSTYVELNKEMDVLEFYKMLSPIISKIGCGHTAVGLPDREENYIKSFIPIKLKFLDGKAYIIENFSDSSQLELCQEVVAINGEPISELVENLFNYIETDGFSKNNKYFHLDNKFEIYYGLYISQPDSFDIKVVRENNSKSSIKVQALLKRGIRKPKPISNSPHKYPFYMDLINSKTALITIDLFYVYDQKDKDAYPKFLDSCFTLLKKNKVKNLLIDVRQNPGGYGTRGALLYSYLTNKPFAYYKQAVVATNKHLPFIKYLNIDYTEEEYNQYLKEIKQTDSGTLVWTNHENLKIQQPQNNHFQGNTYVLIGRKSFSTTAEFCALTYSNQKAIFVGEETGGGYYNVNGGDLPELKLPNTGIKFKIPMRKYELAVKKLLPEGSGTIPDFYVSQSIDDFLNTQDTVLKFTMQLIEKNRRKLKRTANITLDTAGGTE